MIKKIKLFVNNNDESRKVAEIVKQKFLEKGFIISEDDFDLGIAIGGDGSFLRMVRTANFDSNVHYLGINTGTLGFMQDIMPNEIGQMLNELEKGEYDIDNIGIQETFVHAKELDDNFYNLNEIIVRVGHSLLNAKVTINGILLEEYAGDGLLIATPYGSTAQNLSYGGCIVEPTFLSLQITPMGPIVSKRYNPLTKSYLTMPNKMIKIEPISEYRDYDIAVDGVVKTYQDVKSVETIMDNKKIRVLRFSHYNFTQKVNEKLL